MSTTAVRFLGFQMLRTSPAVARTVPVSTMGRTHFSNARKPNSAENAKTYRGARELNKSRSTAPRSRRPLASSISKKCRGVIAPTRLSGGNITAAEAVGALIAERARQSGVARVVFDRGGFKYHGRVRGLADAARKG